MQEEKSRLAELKNLEDAAQKDIKESIKKALNTFLSSVKPGKNIPKNQDIKPDFYTLTSVAGAVVATERLISAAFLLGAAHAERDRTGKKINAADGVDIPAIPFAEAVMFLKTKVPLTKSEWLDIEPKLRFRAFTVAKLAEVDYINYAKNILVKSLESGTGYQDTWNELNEMVDTDALNLEPGYWENVYRTNTASAYTAGKLKQFEKYKPTAYRLLVIEDGRTSQICRHLAVDSGHGVTLPADHPFWKKHGFPPYHFQCRTGIQGVYKSQLQNKPVKDIPMSDFRSFKVQKGFGGNPLDNGNWWMMIPSQTERAIEYGILSMFNRGENVFADYDSVWTGYKRYAGSNGGWYDLCSNPPNDWATDNEAIVKILAANGHKVKVIPEIRDTIYRYGVKWSNPDIMLDGNLADIKNVTASIKSRLKSAREQRVKTVVLNIPDSFTEQDIRSGFAKWEGEHHSPINVFWIYKGKIQNTIL